MKYATIGPRGSIYHVSERKPQILDEAGVSFVEITDEQAKQIEDGLKASPPVRYCFDKGELLTNAEKFAREEKQRKIARFAAMTPGQKIQAGERHILQQGYNATRLLALLERFMKAKETNTLSTLPKLSAVYAWTQQVTQMALSGDPDFPPAPYSFDEVLTEE